MSDLTSTKIDFLKRLGTEETKHSGGTLLDHLVGVSNILEEMGAPQHVQDAGLFHSIYGEASSRNMPKNLYLTRDELIDIIGQQAEQVVYEFCSISDPRSQNILLYPDGQLKKDLILLDRANEEQMNG